MHEYLTRVETLVANLSPVTRRARLAGRSYLVAPVTMIVPGVMNGSGGPVYYSLEEIRREAPAWNGMPLVVYHPTVNGAFVSARDPDILEQQGIGYLFKAKAVDRLAAEAWFDEEHTQRVDPRVIQSLELGTKVEVSTGMFVNLVKTDTLMFHNERPYQHEAKSIRPDHLAVLPDQIGACSILDGCGLNVNTRWEELRVPGGEIIWG